MAVNVPGVPSSQKTPGVYFNVIFGGPGTSSGLGPNKILVFGNQIGSLITPVVNTSSSTTSHPPTTTAAGTAIPDQPSQIFSAADAAAQFGFGSEGHLAAKVIFAQDPGATAFFVPVDESAGVRATGIITPTIPVGPVTPGTIRVIVCGRFVDVPVSATDTVSTIGMNIALAINNQPDWPVTAGNNLAAIPGNVWATGVVTLVAKHPGPRGNYITFRVVMYTASANVKATAGALSATLFGVTITLSGGTTAGGVYQLSGGGTDDVWTTALANVASTRFHRYAVPAYQAAGAISTNIALVATQIDTMAGPLIGIRQQAIYGMTDALGTATTLAEGAAIGLDRSRGMAPWHPHADDLPIEVAAQAAAGRLAGDAQAGGSTVGESTNPSANLNGLEFVSLRAQDVVSDVPLPTQVEAALNNGLSPILPSHARPGFTRLVKSITTRSQDANGLPNYAVFGTFNVTVTDYCADDLQGDLQVAYRTAKLVPDDPSGAAPKIDDPTTLIVTPLTAKARIYAKLKDYERAFWIYNVDKHLPDLAVAIDGTSVSRLDCDIPLVPSPDLDITAANIRQLNQ